MGKGEEIKEQNIFERNVPREVESKYIPRSPESVSAYRKEAMPIEQYYLSDPLEPFSLRLREQVTDNGIVYEATLKDRGIVRPSGLDRLEVTTEVPVELYSYYLSEDVAILPKLRAEPLAGVAIDYYEDGSVQLESENPASWAVFSDGRQGEFIEITGSSLGDNEQRAYSNLLRRRGIDYRDNQPTPIDIGATAQAIANQAQANGIATLHMSGRSGSGKTTVVREIEARLDALGLSSLRLSTDDYHRGKAWLERYNSGRPWEKWDEPIVYDLKAMSQDLAQLRAGYAVQKREIDWTTVEPRYGPTITPCNVIIVEGIYAKSPEIMVEDAVVRELSTPLATCVGRRLLRDLEERPQFADPSASLLYMLSEAEPAYRRQMSSSAA